MTSKNNKRVRPKPGDVFAIPITGGRYVFGRYLRDCGLAIYDYISEKIIAIEELKEVPIRFFGEIFTNALESGEWPRIGHIPSETPNEDWKPPRVIEDILKPGTYSFIYKGNMRKATKEQIKGYQRHCMWFPQPFIEVIETEFNRPRRKLAKQEPPPGWKK